ncbi:MAG TPA: HAD-IIIA family hydrolase [Phycisphaerae bacterium]|nr:HAD-IIIA family hydrolase [Phycisphaerae bacterium]
MPNNRRAAVFVDRDNTLIHDPGYLRHAEHVRVLSGVGQAIEKLRGAGLPVVVVTNQSGVARGYLTEAELSSVHERMQELLQENGSGVDAIYYCPYLTGPDAVVEKYRKDSDLRKPKPGMLIQAAADLKLDLRASWMIGDSERDVVAGRAVGCKTILIASGNNKIDPPPDFTAASFSKAAEIVLRETKVRAQKAATGTPARETAEAPAITKPPAPSKRREDAQRNSASGSALKGLQDALRMEDSKSGAGVGVASPTAVRIADPQVRILAPSAAEAHRNLVDPDAEAARGPKPVQDPQRFVPQGESGSPRKVIPPEPELVPPPKESGREAPGSVAIDEKARASERRNPEQSQSVQPVHSSIDSTAAKQSGPAVPTIAKHAEKSERKVVLTGDAVASAAPAPHIPEHLLENFATAAPEPSLGQVLEEVRSIKREQRYSDFSFAQLAAAIAQAFAVCALAFGLYASVNGDTGAATFRVLLAVAFQLMALTGFNARRKP